MNRKDFLKAGLVMIGGVWVPKQQGATIIIRGPRQAAAGGASFFDDFNRADEYPLGGDWQVGLGSWASPNLQSNRLFNFGGYLTRVKTTTATFAATQKASITLVSTYEDNVGPAVLVDGSGNGYFVYFASGNFKIRKGASDTSSTAVGSDIAGSVAAGDIIELRHTGGGVLDVYKNGVLQGSRTDGSSPYTSGQPGVFGSGGYATDGFSAADL